MSYFETATSQKTDEHDTPVEFFEPISRAVGGFDLDPCASQHTDLAETNLTKEDGGLRKWFGTVWMNPPYSDVAEWVSHAQKQVVYSHADVVVGLVFARTGTQWFHKHAATADLLCFVEGRLTFGNADKSAPAPSLVIVWGDYNERLVKTLESNGMVVEP